MVSIQENSTLFQSSNLKRLIVLVISGFLAACSPPPQERSSGGPAGLAGAGQQSAGAADNCPDGQVPKPEGVPAQAPACIPENMAKTFCGTQGKTYEDGKCVDGDGNSSGSAPGGFPGGFPGGSPGSSNSRSGSTSNNDQEPQPIVIIINNGDGNTTDTSGGAATHSPSNRGNSAGSGSEDEIIQARLDQLGGGANSPISQGLGSGELMVTLSEDRQTITALTLAMVSQQAGRLNFQTDGDFEMTFESDFQLVATETIDLGGISGEIKVEAACISTSCNEIGLKITPTFGGQERPPVGLKAVGEVSEDGEDIVTFDLQKMDGTPINRIE